MVACERLPRRSRIAVERGLRVLSRDGASLATDVYRPEGGPPVPAILFRTPYERRFLAQHCHELDPLQAAEFGFAVMLQDVRGRGGSSGTYDPFLVDGDDGVDTLRWAAQQRWCDGRTAMAGGSYNGIVQLLTAARRPPSLRAIAPRLCGSPYRIWYPGGVLNLGLLASWIVILATWELDRRAANGASTQHHRDALRAVAASPPLTRVHELLAQESWLRQLTSPALAWLVHDTLDGYWERFHVVDQLDPAMPGWHATGWFDACLAPTLETYDSLTARWQNGVHSTQHLTIGPWSHGNPHGVFPERDFGREASAEAAGLMAEQLRFFAHYVAGTGDAPAPVRVFVMGDDRWREEARWPPAGVRELRLYLRSGGQANGVHGDGHLSAQPPGIEEPPDTYVHDPLCPVPTVGGATLLDGMAVAANAGPRDQRLVEARQDVLVYTGEVLERPVELAGQAIVAVFAETDAVDTDFMAKLVDVSSDGRGICVCDGAIRAQLRDDVSAPAPVPRDAVAYSIPLGPTSYVFAAGHRVRLQLASSDFPRYYPNSSTGHRLADGPPTRHAVARQRIHHSAVRASFMTMLVMVR